MYQEEFLNNLINPNKYQDSFSLKSLTKIHVKIFTQYAFN